MLILTKFSLDFPRIQLPQAAFTRSKLTIETLEQGVEYVQN